MNKVLAVILLLSLFSLFTLSLNINGFFTLEKEPKYVTTTQNYLSTPHQANPNNLNPESQELKIELVRND